jgi:membrane peptidoglycan carboxypeptidase
MLDSIPHGLIPKLAGMRMAGSFALKGSVRFDTARLDRDYNLTWDISNTCRVTEALPEIDIARWRKPFRLTVLGPAGERVEIESGPGTPGWVPYGSISRFMEAAVMTTEDSGFRRHSGFDSEAIRNSIRENLRKGRFVRGASTISMQLAKNLYLDRVKNLSRKLQEAVLTSYLEQELTKEQILELYFNVVEFGPMIYGIGPAARYYFNTSASALSLGQAFYIASLLPNPKQQHFGMGGEVSDGWTNYLRKLMQLANKRKWVSDEELEEGLQESVIRGRAAPERAARDRDSPTPPAHGEGPGDVQPPDGAVP